jgi:hypothetical protein
VPVEVFLGEGFVIVVDRRMKRRPLAIGEMVDRFIRIELDVEAIAPVHAQRFEEIGLPWAARNYALSALSQQFTAFKKSGSISDLRASLLARYFDTELKLGRLPQILSAHELEIMVRSAQARTGGQRRRLETVQQSHMMDIGSLLLQTPLEKLSEIAQLPDALERLALPMSRVVLLYFMGHEDALRAEGAIPEQETSETAEAFMKDLRDYGKRTGYPPHPEFGLGTTVTISSNVLGCRIEATCANNLVSIGIGEAVLGSLEALLATSLDHPILPQVDHLQLRIIPSDESDLTPALVFADADGEPIGTVSHSMVREYKTKEDAFRFRNWLRDAILEIFLRFAAPRDIERWGNALFDDERALDRALTFSDVPTMLGHLHGGSPQLSLSDWIDPADHTYEVKRTQPMSSPLVGEPRMSFAEAKKGDGLAPKAMRDAAKAKHSTTHWISPIDTQKWDKAKWNGTIFMWSPPEPGTPPPILGLTYQNPEVARDIFTSWRKRYGEDEVKNDLQITIVRGISKKNPAAYAVMVSQNPANIPVTEGVFVGFVSRINRMYPQSTQNLDSFLADYDRHGKYVLVPAHLPNKHAQPRAMFDLPIGKHSLAVKYAWQIPPNDLSASVLDLDEPPSIPEDQPDAPVLKTLEWLRSLRELRD